MKFGDLLREPTKLVGGSNIINFRFCFSVSMFYLFLRFFFYISPFKFSLGKHKSLFRLGV